MSENKIFNLAVLSITTVGVAMLYNYTTDNNLENIVEATRAIQVESVNPIISSIVENKSYYGIIKGIKEEKLYPGNQSKALELFVKTGDVVKKGDILAIYDSSKVDEQLKMYEDNYNRVLKDKERIETEVNKIKDKLKNISKEIEDNQKIIDYYAEEYDKPTPIAEVTKAKDNLINLSEDRVELEEYLDSLDLTEYINRLSNAEKSKEVIQKSKEGYTIKAPFDGVITSMDAKIGELNNPFLAPIEISDNSEAILSIKLPKEEIENIKVGMKFNVVVHDRDNNITDKDSIVEYVSDKEDSLTRMYNVKLKLNDNNVKIGSSGLLEIPISEKTDAMLIPRKAIHKDGKKSFVYTVNRDNKVEKKYVTTGIKDDSNIEVLNGLNKNENIITTKNSDIKEGVVVTLK